jgi:hypothetical protein
MNVPLHVTEQVLPPDYFSPPSQGDNHVNDVEAYFPPSKFIGAFRRVTKGQPWVKINRLRGLTANVMFVDDFALFP